MKQILLSTTSPASLLGLNRRGPSLGFRGQTDLYTIYDDADFGEINVVAEIKKMVQGMKRR